MKSAQKYIKFLGLKLPVRFRVIKGSNKWYDAIYEPIYGDGKLQLHSIVICTAKICREFETLTAHELIHAAQEEKGLTENHGPFFKRMAKKMGKEFGLVEIFIKGVDKK